MKTAWFLIFFFSLVDASAQINFRHSLEFATHYSFEDQGKYTTRFGERSWEEKVALSGYNSGFELVYKRYNRSNWFAKGGLGYCRVGVNDISDQPISSTFPPSDGRHVNFRYNSTYLLYSTNRYYYNDLGIGIGGGKMFGIGKKYAVTSELNLTKLFSFSQVYKTKSDVVFRNKDWRDFGFSINGRVGIKRTFKSYYLSAQFFQTIYKQWPKDEAFLENPNEHLSLWWSGCGFGLTVGRTLK